VLVADGDHDEAIKRAHTEYIAATIPGAGLLILPNRASVGGFWAKAAGSFGFSPQIVMWPVWLHRNAARPAALLRQLRVGRKAPLEILKPSKVAR
jgi:hypothetical protein